MSTGSAAQTFTGLNNYISFELTNAGNNLTLTVTHTWDEVATGDFAGDNDGTADVLKKNMVTGEIGYYQNGAATRTNVITTVEDADVLTAVDCNGDGAADLQIFHAATNSYSFWSLNGGTWSETEMFTGDFYNDGTDDVLAWNQTTGELMAWNNNDSTTAALITTASPTGWEIDAIGDFNHDNIADLRLHEIGTDNYTYWHVNTDTNMWQPYLGFKSCRFVL